MKYTITFTRQSLKSLQKINEPYYSKIKVAIADLAADPRPHGYKKLHGQPGYRIRVADYRVIYDIFDDIIQVDVLELGHRKDIYE